MGPLLNRYIMNKVPGTMLPSSESYRYRIDQVGSIQYVLW